MDEPVETLQQTTSLLTRTAIEYGPRLLAAALVLLGLGNAVVAAVFGGALKARIENVTEWWGALIFVAVFLALSAM
jgi:hypothetical protein